MSTYSSQVSRHVRAPRERVYRALLDPEAVRAWRVPDGMTSEVHEFDARQGGSFRISLTYCEGPGGSTATGKSAAHTDTYHGRFVRLVPDEEVVEELAFETADPAMAGLMRMTTTLVDDAGGTRVVLRHDGVPDRIPAAENETGTRMALANLARLVEADLPAWEPLTAEFAGRSLAAGDATGWFEPLYAAGRSGSIAMPWDRGANPLLVGALADVDGAGRTAVVVGCGLGADAEEVARHGFRTTAFDVSPTAVAIARERHPASPVEYRVADLFALPADWVHAFDLVVEIITVQALPPPRQAEAAAAVSSLVGPGGDLLVISGARTGRGAGDGPPWPLARADLDAFADGAVTSVRVDEVSTPQGPKWLAWFAART